MDAERLDPQPLQSMGTPELLRHTLQEARTLAQAEVTHARAELRSEIAAAKRSGILVGAGVAGVICALSVLFVALALLIPWDEALAVGAVGFVLLAGGAAALVYGATRLPKRALPRTRERLKRDLDVARVFS